MLQGNQTGAVWIGANDRAQEGNWQWTDLSPWEFTHWANVEFPSNSRMFDGEGENCAVVLFKTIGSSEWRAVPCHSQEMQFVCGKPLCSSDKNSQNNSNIEAGQAGKKYPADVKGVFWDQTTVLLIVLICFGFLIGIVVFLVVLCSFRKRRSIQSVRDADENPVYGMYYFADGTKIDSGSSTAQDTNSTYVVGV